MNIVKHPLKLATRVGLTFGVAMAASLSAHATKVKASCYLLNRKGETIQGVNTSRRYEIASVSKVMTALWAVDKLGVNHRFKTKIHILPVGKNIADVHIEGAKDPFFNREQLQFVVSELNKLGVSQVRKLTFDENFKFLATTRESSVAVGHYSTAYPQVSVVQSQLEAVISRINGLYASTRARAKAINEMDLPDEIALSVKEVAHLTKADFNKDSGFQGPTARHFTTKSVVLMDMLKEMNRNSNNYAANLIFEGLGGASEFKKYADTTLGLKETAIRFVNGSGDRFDVEDGPDLYNEASCQAIIVVLAGLKNAMEDAGKTLADVMAVAGSDPEGEHSTVSNIYDNEATHDALIAKTGTVNPSITLAGMASTEEGNVYFGYIYGTNGTKADQRNARGHIRQDIVKLFAKFKGKKEIDYEADKFISFDSRSALTEIKPEAPKAAPVAPVATPSVAETATPAGTASQQVAPKVGDLP